MPDVIEQLESWVKENYNAPTWGSIESNEFDYFDNGFECGVSLAAFEVGMILGMDIEMQLLSIVSVTKFALSNSATICLFSIRYVGQKIFQ